jgi:tripeptide aminopeptidase
MALLNIQSASRNQDRMMNFMHDALEDAGMVVRRKHGQLYATKGNTDNPVPVYVAHADTVHRIVRPDWYAVGVSENPKDGDRLYYGYDPGANIDRGVGGDDKCGMFVCMEAARELDNVGVIITRDEEIGAIGASLVTSADIAHAAVLIQADRRGARDAVRSTFGGVTISSDEWQAHVQESITVHGYDWCDSGLFTDVTRMHEDRIASVSAINISAGYYNPHTPSEYISEYDLEWALALAIDLGTLSAGKKWRHEYVPKRYEGAGEYTWRRGRNHRNNRYDDWDARWEAEGWGTETQEDDITDDDRGDALTGGVQVRINGVDRWIYPVRGQTDDEDLEEAIWEGVRQTAQWEVMCEMPDCDQDAYKIDYDTGMWLCDEHRLQFEALDDELVYALAAKIKNGNLDEGIEVHMNLDEAKGVS